MAAEELFYLPVTELARRIEAKTLSPVDLTQMYLSRSEKIGPKLNAYARLTPEIAMAQASAAEKEIRRGHYRGPLHGIPYAAKDLLAVKGVPVTWGAKPYADQVFDYDATVIEHLNRAGCGDDRQGFDDRACRRDELSVCVGFAAGRGEESVEYELLDLRIVVGVGRDCGGGVGGVCDRDGDLGIDCLPVGVLRRERDAADVWAREQVRGDGAGTVDGQDWADGEVGGRLRANFCGAGGA